ncbi:MAG: CBS domain-containing protein [Anaerolineae bacterium]|nr:CBS domain-containing protein [Anaerolineae bacterium]
MKKNFVKDWMSDQPVTIPPETTVPEAYQVLKDNNVRRLPVIDGSKLVGIVTRGDVREAGPSDATSLSIYELNYLLAKLSVGEIMTKDPITVTPETSLHEVAKIMLESKIGGLPVVADGKVVGIITESDVFRAMIELFS